MKKAKKQLSNFLKYNRYAYCIYYYLLSGFLNLLKFFVKTDSKLILFNSFAGRNYSDSPKAIYEKMKQDKRFENYKFVWAFHYPENYIIDGAKTIKTDGIKYFVTALTARIWITNSSIERGLSFKGRKTLYVNTWHGTPLKKMGEDITIENSAFKSKARNSFDLFCTQGTYEQDIFSRSFNIGKEKMLLSGLPRNDVLTRYTSEDNTSLRKKLGIPKDRIVILYCPTFREYNKDDRLGCIMAPPISLEKWEKALGENHVLLIRAHYEISKKMLIEEDGFVYDVTRYDDINDLFLVADILVSDYSSVFFDFSIMEKPMFHFCYDYDEYARKRGLYFDIRSLISGAEKEDDLIRIIQESNMDIEKQKAANFKKKYVTQCGFASEKVINEIAARL